MKQLLLLIGLLVVSQSVFAQQMWRGLVVAPENRCSPYDKKKQYPYPQSVEDIIVANMGGVVYGPYTGRIFESDRATDIEHLLSTSEGHDSGLCRASAEVREQFATDPLNLTLASPKVNRCSKGGKCGFDAGEWMPPVNQCWFANRVVEIKRKYSLTIDVREARVLENTLSGCTSTEMIFFDNDGPRVRIPDMTTAPTINQSNTGDALTLYDDNGNGKITCKEARSHRITPVRRNHPAYPYMYDRDNDGVVCE